MMPPSYDRDEILKLFTTQKKSYRVGALGHSPSPAHPVAVVRFGFLNIGRINRRSNGASNCVHKPPGPQEQGEYA
jgi:hypothetical protein